MAERKAAIAFIPARGGSKRLPRKNVIDFYGKPIIFYTIKSAIKSGLFDRIIVSSEDKEILDIAKQCGVETALREKSLATDEATIVDVCIDWLQANSSLWSPEDIFCCLYATAPLRTHEDIEKVCSLLDWGNCNYAIAATHYIHYAHQALDMDNEGWVVPMWPELASKRSEEVGNLVCGNGSTYATFCDVLIQTGSFYGEGMKAYMMPVWRSIDIDTKDDLLMASLVARHPDARIIE